jgi:trimeric autotransporter adhesin
MAALFLGASVAAHAQSIVASPTSISLSGQANGGPSVTASLTLTGTATGFLILVSPSQPAPWLTINPQTGNSLPAVISLVANPTGLPAGNYSTTLQVLGAATQLSIPVAFSVGNIGVAPSSLSFSYTLGASVPLAQSLTITSFQSVVYQAVATTNTGGNWLQVSPTAGTTPSALAVQLNQAVLQSLAAGTYTGTISITAPASGTSGATVLLPVPVTLTVAAAAQVTPSPSQLNFGIQSGGTNNVLSQTITLTTNSTIALSFGVSLPVVNPNPAGTNWLTVAPSSGVIPANGSAQLTVTVLPGSLPAGTYAGRFTVQVPGATPATFDIPVQLTISSLALLNVPSAPLSFSYQVGTSIPAAQSVTPTSTSSVPMQYSIAATTTSGGNWLVVPPSGTTPNAFQVAVNPTGLAPATYSGTVTVTGIGSGNGPQQIPVTLKVGNDPVILANTNALSFAYQVGQSQPPSQLINLTSSTGSPLTYSVSAQPSWVVLSGNITGSTNGAFSVQANVVGQAAGSYDGVVTITATNPATGIAAPNSPLSIPVKLVVSNTALLIANPISLSFSAQVGTNQSSAQQILLNSTNPTEQLTFTVTFSTDNGGNWLIAGPTQGSSPNTLNVLVVPTLLSAGTYTGSVRITATGLGGAAVGNSPIVVPVTLTMTQGTMSVSPSALTFTQAAGGAAPAPQTISITTNGPAINYTVSVSAGVAGFAGWVNASATGGTTPGSVIVTVDGSRLGAGTYQGSVTVTAAGVAGSPATIPVTLTVTAGTISAAPTALTFSAAQNSAAPAAQNISVTGTGAINYTVQGATVAGGNWLSVNASAGTTPGTISVSVNPAGLSPGNYSGAVTITAPGASGSPITIPVSFTITAPQTLSAQPLALSFSFTNGLSLPAAQNVVLASSGGNAPFTATVNTTGVNTWLAVAPSSGTTPATLTVSITNPQNLAAGTYTGVIAIQSAAASNTISVAVSLTVIAIPPPNVVRVTNAASFIDGPVAPGEFITLGGVNLGPANLTTLQLDNSGQVATLVAETRVLFDGVPAPIYYVSATQSSVIVPFSVASRASTNMVVEYRGVQSQPISLRVVDVSPGIFTLNSQGSGPGAILNQNYSVNSANNPAAKLSGIQVYASGGGQTSPAGVSGAISPNTAAGQKTQQALVTATIGGVPARVLYAGTAPGFVNGVMQVNIEVPAGAPSGSSVPLIITVGGVNSQNGVTVAIQ